MDTGVEAELVDFWNYTIFSSLIIRNGRDHLLDWLGSHARISVAMYNRPL